MTPEQEKDLARAARKILEEIDDLGDEITLGLKQAWGELCTALEASGIETVPEPTPEPVRPCEGFAWIGQALTSCDECGRPVWEHPGERRHSDPFSDAYEVEPWSEDSWIHRVRQAFLAGKKVIVEEREDGKQFVKWA